MEVKKVTRGRGTRRVARCRDAGAHVPVEDRHHRLVPAVWCEQCWMWVFTEPVGDIAPRTETGRYPDVLTRDYR